MHILEDLSTYWKNFNLKRGRGLLLWGITCVIYKCWPKKKGGTCYLVISLNLEVQKNVLNNSSTCPEDGSEKGGATMPCLKEPQKGGKELTHLLILDVLKSVKLRNFYDGSTYNSFFFPSHLSNIFLQVVVHFILTVQRHVLCHDCPNLWVHVWLHKCNK